MDTPAKSHALSTAASNSQDSPVFHYINNLSPLELVKSSETNQPFNLLNSASPLPVFASPRIDTCKQNLEFGNARHHLSGPLASDFSKNEASDGASLESLKLIEELHAADGKTNFQDVISTEHHTILPIEHNGAYPLASHTNNMQEQEYASGIFSWDKDDCNRTDKEIFPSEQSAPDLVTLGPVVDYDVMNLASSILVGDDQMDPGTVVSTADIVHNLECSTNEEPEVEHGLGNSLAEAELEQNFALSALVQSHNTLHELGISSTKQELAERHEVFTTSHRHGSFLRRCLFSVMTTSTNNNSGATSLSISESASDYLISREIYSNESLNVNQTISLEEKMNLHDNKVSQGNYDCHTSTPVGVEVHGCSPLTKRNRCETDVEIGSCKRCNCRRSKCLKLYCKCFAAGLYCIEPCTCQACFNRPNFKDKVLETRRQIESRNPIAFTPKVVRDGDSYMECGEEGTKTPASARHKKGCRCKRSSCLKKYCECFQAGIGCSFQCKCEGCKNKYGCKDEQEGRYTESRERASSDITLRNDESKEDHADLLGRHISHDSSQTKAPFTVRKNYTGISSSNNGTPRAFSTRKLGISSTFSSKHTSEKQGEIALDAENRDVNQETVPPQCSLPRTLKNSSPRATRASHLLPPSWSFSSHTALRSSRRREILRSITSLGKTD